MTDDLRTSLGTFLRQNNMPDVIAPLIRLVATGRPVELAELAEESGLPVDGLMSWLRAQPGTDWDEHGRLLGFGLTQCPTRHRFTVQGRELFTFCAADTLLFAPILGSTAHVESTCPKTGQPIRIDLAPDRVLAVDPAAAVVSQVALCPTADIRASICDHGHFFASAEAAGSWRRAHPGGQVLPVREFFGIALTTGREMRWAGR
ncbi:MAG: organomercurial lyase MerB [Mycobacterium sp.]|nr:organomercurial lyase MerB [Mycobacterium sp.]